MRGKASILIVDDEAGLRGTLADILRAKGYLVVEAANGFEAIQTVKRQLFDFIFIDMRMPGIDGVETYKEIKQICPQAKVAMITAYAVEDLVQEALSSGAYGVLYKPLDMKKAMGLLEKALLGS